MSAFHSSNNIQVTSLVSEVTLSKVYFTEIFDYQYTETQRYGIILMNKVCKNVLSQ